MNAFLPLLLALPLHAFAANGPLTFTDGELVPAGEDQAIRVVTGLIRSQVEASAAKDGRAFRDAHRKHHGCVRATFTVLSDAPTTLREGIFAKEKTYQAVIRYSNGSGQVQDDHDGDGRGMAVKVLGVEGERNLSESDDEKTSQDFLMINHPVFFVRNAADYVSFQEAVQSGKLLWWILNPTRVFHEGLIARAIQKKTMINPLEATYFSMTASKLGPKQMKFRAKPCEGNRLDSSDDSKNRLGENLSRTLGKNEICFDFQLQLRSEPRFMPVEDPTVEWDEEASPYRTVARIFIPAQSVDKSETCESLSFNPWNGLAEHRPLGGISRVRKEVYQAISRFRHDFNKQRREEPATAEVR